MDIYIFIFILLLILSALNSKNNILYIFILVFLICVLGFRGNNVGVDTGQYLKVFEWIRFEGSYPIEPGWVLLNIIVAKIGGSFLVLLTVVSVLTLVPIFFVVRKCSPYVFFSIFIFYGLHLYCGAFNIMRQYLAVSLVFLAYYFFQREKMKFALLFFLLACSAHYSCILSAVIPFFNRITITNKKFIYLTLVSFIFGSIVNERLVDFLTFSEYTNVANFRENIFMSAVFTIAIDSFMLAIASTMRKDLLNGFWGKVFVFSILIFNVTFTLHFSARIYSLFAISQIIVLPMYVKCNTFKRKEVPIVLVMTYVSVQFWRMYLTNANNILPYNLNVTDLRGSFLNFLI